MNHDSLESVTYTKQEDVNTLTNAEEGTLEAWVYANKEIMDAVTESYEHPERLIEWDRSSCSRR
jgi:hypothetical protein